MFSQVSISGLMNFVYYLSLRHKSSMNFISLMKLFEQQKKTFVNLFLSNKLMLTMTCKNSQKKLLRRVYIMDFFYRVFTNKRIFRYLLSCYCQQNGD